MFWFYAFFFYNQTTTSENYNTGQYVYLFNSLVYWIQRLWQIIELIDGV